MKDLLLKQLEKMDGITRRSWKELIIKNLVEVAADPSDNQAAVNAFSIIWEILEEEEA